VRRINLLPPEERRRGVSLQSGPFAILLVSGALVFIVIALTTIFCLFRIYTIENRIAELDAGIAEQQARLAELEPYAELEDEIAAKRPVADGIVRTRFAWSEFLRGLAFVIPETTSLETLAAEASPVDINAPLDQILEPRGAVTFTGLSEPDYTNIADFVVRMNTLRFLANAELDLAELDRDTYVSDALDFEVSSELVTEVGANGTEARVGGENEGAAAQQYSNGGSTAGEQITPTAPAAREQYLEGSGAGVP
jgi:type IV pilus assembly protein PilN